jgi:hypothetical protein
VSKASTEGSCGSFFAIDQRTWALVCEWGVNPAAAYLTQACGTGRDNRTTAWSINAIRTYTGMSLSRAQEALGRLIERRVSVLTTGGSRRPRYDLPPWHKIERRKQKDTPELIWLPNAVVTGASGETPPVQLLRQTRDAMTLRLFVDLYHAQNLRDDGGVSRRFLWQKFERHEVGRRGQMTVWGFSDPAEWVSRTGPIEAHCRAMTKDELENRSASDKRDSRNWTGSDAFRRIKTLVDLGLVEWVPHLFEGDDDGAEPIHAYGLGNGGTVEDRLGAAAHVSGVALLTERQADWAEEQGLRLAPVPHHFANVQMIGVARLRYRPKTRMTAAWWAELTSKGEAYIRAYKELAGHPESAVPQTAGATV